MNRQSARRPKAAGLALVKVTRPEESTNNVAMLSAAQRHGGVTPE